MMALAGVQPSRWDWVSSLVAYPAVPAGLGSCYPLHSTPLGSLMAGRGCIGYWFGVGGGIFELDGGRMPCAATGCFPIMLKDGTGWI